MIEIPQCTPIGFEKIKVPTETWDLIQEVYPLLKRYEQIEYFSGKEYFIQGTGNSTIFPIDKVPHQRDIIHKQLHKLHQDWAGREIEPSYVYGIRSYKNGTVLKMHTDTIQTHHIASIISVDKDINNSEDWGLNIIDHSGTEHIIYLEPGEMILYESAICKHGRPESFKGNFYNNLFVHYKFK